MTKKSPPEDYEVGYGKPPRETQFKKGQSGNPRGRPRKSDSDFADIFHRVMLKPEVVLINGKRRKMSGAEVMFRQLNRQASQGDKEAFKSVLQFMKMFPPPNDNESDEQRVMQFRFRIGDEETTRRVAEAVEQERRGSLIFRAESED